MSEYIASAVSTAIIAYMPTQDMTLKLACGAALSTVISRTLNYLSERVPTLNPLDIGRSRVLVSDRTTSGERNPYFDAIAAAVADGGDALNLEPIDGSPGLALGRRSTAHGSIGEMSVRVLPTTGEEPRSIELSSRSWSSDAIVRHVSSILRAPGASARELVIHSLVRDGTAKRASYRWTRVRAVTNKSLDNVFLPRSTSAALVGSITRFISGEAEYARKGIPYQYGAFLHGPPGTGKTSVVKAIAATYGLEIFDIAALQETASDLSNGAVGRMRDVMAMLDLIQTMVVGKRYIVLCDDFSLRCSIGGSSEWRASVQRFLDGAREAHGRMTFMTSNDAGIIREWPQLFRFGRLGCQFQLDRCDTDQLRDLARLFRPSEVGGGVMRDSGVWVGAGAESGAAGGGEIEWERAAGTMTPSEYVQLLESDASLADIIRDAIGPAAVAKKEPMDQVTFPDGSTMRIGRLNRRVRDNQLERAFLRQRMEIESMKMSMERKTLARDAATAERCAKLEAMCLDSFLRPSSAAPTPHAPPAPAEQTAESMGSRWVE